MNSIDQIYYWDNLLTEEEYGKFWGDFNSSIWTFDGRETKHIDNHVRTFWYKELMGSGYILSTLKQKVESFVDNKILTQRLYANGQAHSQTAWIHKDVEDNIPGDYGTLIYFLHPEWKPIYGGNLFFTDESETQVTNTIFPKTNSAVLFNSKIKHCSLEPTVYCTYQRISIAFKFKFKDPNDPEEFIVDTLGIDSTETKEEL